MKNLFAWILAFNALFLWICWYAVYSFTQSSSINEIHEFDSRFTFINPLLECNPKYEYYNPWNVKKEIDTYIKSSIKSEKIEDAAYYVRLLKNGSTFGYNQDAKFISASLVKLPLAISLMRQITPSELNTEIIGRMTQSQFDQYDKPIDNIQSWKSYSINELLSEMLINSDNTAATTLLDYLNTNKIIQTYDMFGLWLVDFNTDKNLNMSVKSYASFFRVLYNSSYLSREDSEYLLKLLSQSTFTSGIRAMLPKDLLISNKFWVRNLPSWERHIHDCGNIYYEDEPYLLCVMTKWNNEKNQLEVIQNISKMVYVDLASK